MIAGKLKLPRLFRNGDFNIQTIQHSRYVVGFMKF